MKFELTILGSNSATPTSERFPSCHVLNVREKLFMVDCGEGAQIQLRKFKFKFSKLNHIFISHMHGDHCLGLPGMIASFSLLGREHDLHIYAHADLQRILGPIIEYFSHDLTFRLIYHDIEPTTHQLIFEDKSIEVWSIPLNHRIATCGFLFKEKKRENNIRKEVITAHDLTIKEIVAIKNGADLISKEGITIPNSDMVVAPNPAPRSYAYISDTKFKPDIASLIEGADLLYHEATFLDEDELRVSKTFHSTATEAAEMAKMAHAKKLLIGHFSARYANTKEHQKAAQAIFENTVAVKDGMKFSI